MEGIRWQIKLEQAAPEVKNLEIKTAEYFGSPNVCVHKNCSG